MLIKRCASVASGSLPAWRATRAAHFLKSGTSDILNSSNPDPFGESEETALRFKKARDPTNLDQQPRCRAARPDHTVVATGRPAEAEAPPTEMGPARLADGSLLRGALTAGRAAATGGAAARSGLQRVQSGRQGRKLIGQTRQVGFLRRDALIHRLQGLRRLLLKRLKVPQRNRFFGIPDHHGGDRVWTGGGRLNQLPVIEPAIGRRGNHDGQRGDNPKHSRSPAPPPRRLPGPGKFRSQARRPREILDLSVRTAARSSCRRQYALRRKGGFCGGQGLVVENLDAGDLDH